jgi:AraC family transcriptional regulator, transcriptional activator of pobA
MTIPLFQEFDESLRFVSAPLIGSSRDFHIFKLEEIGNKQKLEVPPFRLSYFDITFFISSNFSHKVNFYSNVMTDNSIHFISPYQVQSFSMDAAELTKMRGYTIHFSYSFLSVGNDATFFDVFPFFKFDGNPVLYLNESQVVAISDLVQRMYAEYTSANRNEEIIKSYLTILLHQSNRIYRQNSSAKTETATVANPSRTYEITQRFMLLLRQYIRDNRSVKEFADELSITPNHLYDQIKQTTGRTVQQLIQEAQVNEAKILLTQTDLSVSEIAYTLNFEDHSYFAKYFKRTEGLSPTAFREAQSLKSTQPSLIHV